MARRKGEVTLEFRDVKALQPFAGNPKRHEVDELLASFGRWGFRGAIEIVDETIVSGHGRVEALYRLLVSGDDPPSGIEVKAGAWLVPCLVGKGFASDADARAYVVAANRISERGGWDRDALREFVLREDDPINWEGVGWSQDELVAEAAAALDRERPAPPPPDAFPSFGSDIDTDHRCPSCGYEWSGKTS